MKYIIKSQASISLDGKKVEIIPLNDMRQTYDYDCGAQILQTIFAHYGEDTREDKLMKELKTTKKEGTSVEDMIRVAKARGYRVRAGKMTLDRVKNYVLKREIPVMVLVQAWADNKKKKMDWKTDWKDGHWVAVIGFTKGKVLFEDPSDIKRTWMSEKEFIQRWHDTDDKKKLVNYGMVLLGKTPRKTDVKHMD